jgi:3-oxoacyl-[acyl-carrier-protein] synthase II
MVFGASRNTSKLSPGADKLSPAFAGCTGIKKISMVKELKRVVVAGMGTVSPLGNTLDEFWKNIVAGKSGVDMITKFDTANYKTKFAAEVKGFTAANYFEKNEARKYDLFTQYAVAAADEAIKHAGIDFSKLNKNKIGVIWGSGNGGIQTFQEQLEEFFKGNKNPRFNPYFIPKIIADIPSGVISIRYGLRGLNFSTISACASSTNAIIDAFNYIRLGKADIIIVVPRRPLMKAVWVGLMHPKLYQLIMKIRRQHQDPLM